MSKKNKFCVLLTATIDSGDCLYTERKDPKIREQDYIQSARLWLTKTSFPIVFCENSGYDLKNIELLSKQYPGRMEIISFSNNNSARKFGKGYGEFGTIEKAMQESKILKSSENIIKATGRVFIENINDIVRNFKDDTFVEYCIHFRKDLVHLKDLANITHTVVFIFKPDFFSYIKKYSDLIDESRKMSFEKIFEYAIREAKRDGQKCRLMKSPIYVGYSATFNKEYKDLFITRKSFAVDILFIMAAIANKYIGKIGLAIKKYAPWVYKYLKRGD